jgi:Ca2+-transporting ATPase
MIKNPHSSSINEIHSYYNADIEKGLTSSQVKKHRGIYGENLLKQKKAKRAWIIFIEQFLDPIIYVLGIAMILAFAFSDWLEGFAVLTVILLTAFIGYFMELQAVRSVEALQKIAQTRTRVIRNGKPKYLKTRFLVPGDIILLSSGDVIPADARLFEHQSLAVKEAVLTGESNQVEKNNDLLPIDTPLAERYNMLFRGTIAVRGTAKAIVTSTGDQTVIGQISTLTQAAQKERSPLEKRLNELSRWLIGLTLFLALLITISGYFQGKDLVLMVKIGIALAVAAIPEGLPIVATIALARGMVRLSKRKVIIKKLEAVQTLGETNIVCTDKTGTLTQDKMIVHKLILQDTLLDYGDFDNPSVINRLNNNKAYTQLVKVAVLCNNIEEDDENKVGDAIEIALFEFAKTAGFNIQKIRDQHDELMEIPFDAETKLMTTLNRDQKGYMVCVKGASEKIIESSKNILAGNVIQPFINKTEWLNLTKELASKGLRVLAFAYRHTDKEPPQNELIQHLTFLGIIGFLDAPRKDVMQAIQTYKNAGIKVVMITGDHPGTARKVAEEIGLLNSDDGSEQVIHGDSILDLQDFNPGQERKILNATVFARMIPKQKLDLVNFYQKHNAIVGMIGDGVNDTPALKKADIGIAMGLRGTEAAKEVADVILMNDKFTSTELAIRQGRAIYENIRNFVVYLLSCNLAEIISVAVASISNLPLPLLPLQILFLNLVTDVFPALALGMGKGRPDIMKQPPRDPKEPIITKKYWISTIIYGISITLAVIGITIYANFRMNATMNEVNNMAFFTLVLGQLLNVFNMPNSRFSFVKNEVTTNPWIWLAILLSSLILFVAYHIPLLQRVLSLVSLSFDQFIMVGVFGFGSLLLIQLLKRLGRNYLN